MLELNGKTAFVFGVASEDSIAWAICQKLASAGVDIEVSGIVMVGSADCGFAEVTSILGPLSGKEGLLRYGCWWH